MCRIAGIIDPTRYHDQLIADVNHMIDSMIHGGPDGRGVYAHSIFAFGHCRLSLIDLSNSASQPMLDDTNGNALIYNGEIYNFNEIKSALIKKGHQFVSHSDTEVILKAYKEWGNKAFEKFNGMFAFAIFDKSLNKIILVRDPNGIKPLYYFLENNQLIFASELKAFKELVVDENNYWRELFLSYGFIPEPYTKYENVFMLEASSILEFDLNTFKISKSIFQFQSESNVAYKNEEDIKFSLLEAVNRHLISDAPIGLFLSGGIDSSILTILASASSNQINTLSINFNELEYSEKKFQDLMVDITQSHHHSFEINKKIFDDNISTIYQAYDMPSNDGVNTWFISKFAKENNLKAVLSGLGADEIFGGYPSFKRVSQLKKLHQFKNLVLSSLKVLPSKFERLEFLKLDDHVSDYLLLRGFNSPSKVAKILDVDVNSVLLKLNEFRPNTTNKVETIDNVSTLEKNIYMRNQLLRDSDAMSMQHGVEIRVPFLDNEFLSLISSIKTEILFKISGQKSLLINAFKDVLPDDIWNRPKKGFQFPFKEWFKDSEFIKDKMSSTLKQKEYDSFNIDNIHWSKIWALAQV
jgi:asparagine synthase (glutamine-hydrolysing)